MVPAPPSSCNSKLIACTIRCRRMSRKGRSLGKANGVLMAAWGHPFGGRAPERRRQAAGFRPLFARWLATLIVLFPIVLSTAYQSRPTAPGPGGDLARFLSTFGGAASICWTRERPTQPAPATPQQDWPATDRALCPVCQLLQHVVGCPPPLVALLIPPQWVAAPRQRRQVANLPRRVSAFLPAVRAPPH